MKLLKIVLYLLPLLLTAVSGCEPRSAPRGTAVVVNDEPVSLRIVQALMDTRQVSLNSAPRPSVREMRDSYANAAAILITSALVRQELAERGMDVSKEDFERAVQDIKDDLGEENFNLYLAETALREDEWRILMLDHLSMEQFMKKVILPAIHIDLDEIRAAYEDQKSALSKPALYRICYGVADKKENIEAWCKSGDEKSFADLSTGMCFNAPLEDIVPPWRDEVKKLKPLSCGKIIEQDGQWRSMAFIGRMDGETMKLSEAYPLLENILYEEKKKEAFDKWLEKKLASARISAAPELFQKSDF